MINHSKPLRQRLAERRMKRAKRFKELCYLGLLAVLGCIVGCGIFYLNSTGHTSNSSAVSVQQRHVQEERRADSGRIDRGRGRGHGVQVMSVAHAAQKPQPIEYELEVQATAYWTHDPIDASGHGIAFDGTPAVAYKTCAVDPKVIPLQSMVYVPQFGWLRANDTGNAIKGAIIDIAMPSREAAWNWGRRKVLVKVRPPQPKEGGKK